MDESTVAEMRGVTAGYGTHVALRDVSLGIVRGEVFGLLGHNGAGKTTTIRLLNGVLAPDSGTVRVFGADPVADGTRVRRDTAVVLQDPGVDDRQTPRDHLRFYGRIYGVADSERRIGELLERFELADRADDRVAGFSHGMRRKLALSRALLAGPALLYLDEPTSGLDPVSAKLLRDLIAGLGRSGHTIVLASHDLSEVERLCDRVAILREGRVVALDTPRALAEQTACDLNVRLAVPSDAGVAAVHVLEHVTEVSGVRIDEPDVVTFRIARKADIPDVLRLLLGDDVPVYGLEVERPRLETVYLRLHGATDAESAPRDRTRQA